MPDGQEQPAGRSVDQNRVLAKLQELDPRLVQLAVLQVVAEDQEQELAQLRAELVAVTSGQAAAE